jgi:hypothetical protein
MTYFPSEEIEPYDTIPLMWQHHYFVKRGRRYITDRRKKCSLHCEGVGARAMLLHSGRN